jgi:carbon starvation protein
VNVLPLVLGALCVIAIAYRYYSAFLATKVAVLDDARATPAHRCHDGHNFVPTSRWVLFGHHFAAITGAGPLIGPVLAAQFGYLPGLLWLVIGVCLAGAVQDFIILAASVRRGGRSLAEIARQEISGRSGVVAGFAIFFIVVIALAGLGLAVVNALKNSPWGVFTIGTTIPIALAMGLYMYRIRPGAIREASIVGVILLLLAVVLGRPVANSALARWFTFDALHITYGMAAYGFIASVLPVWMLLCPRDYLSSYMKIGTIAALILGLIVVHPTLQMPALTRFIHGGGPIIPGTVFPFCFITIACGAISGFHALVGSGTTPKMIDKESDIRPIGYGAMLMEGVVGLTALFAATSLHLGDYFAINVPPAKFASLGLQVTNLPALSAAVGEQVAGRTGGAVSLALGMAQIFSALPGMKALMGYWYHFAIMFEALFILTTIDTGTRVGRFLVQEFLGRAVPQFSRTDWIPGTVISTLLVVASWAYFIATGSIDTIWPMFGIANQLLAAIALAVGTSVIINSGRARYAWATAVPMLFVAVTTITAGVLSIRDNFLPKARSTVAKDALTGRVDTVLTVLMITCVVIILLEAVLRWTRTLSRGTFAQPAEVGAAQSGSPAV